MVDIDALLKPICRIPSQRFPVYLRQMIPLSGVQQHVSYSKSIPECLRELALSFPWTLRFTLLALNADGGGRPRLPNIFPSVCCSLRYSHVSIWVSGKLKITPKRECVGCYLIKMSMTGSVLYSALVYQRSRESIRQVYHYGCQRKTTWRIGDTLQRSKFAYKYTCTIYRYWGISVKRLTELTWHSRGQWKLQKSFAAA